MINTHTQNTPKYNTASKNLPKIILASSSPRRRELLTLAGISFEVLSPSFDESSVEASTPEELVKVISEAKAEEIVRSVAEVRDVKEDILVIAADTVVAKAEEGVQKKWQIYGKPRDRTDAFRMLSSLSNAQHEVFTGVTILELRAGNLLNISTTNTFSQEGCNKSNKRTFKKVFSKTFCSEVTFRELKKEEIEAYLETPEAYDKAGAYALQGRAQEFITKISGSYTGIIGLPLADVVEFLQLYSATNEATVQKNV